MIARIVVTSAGVGCLLACSSPTRHDTATSTTTLSPAASAAGLHGSEPAEPQPAAAQPTAAAAPPPVEVVPAPVPAARPPHKVVKGAGISIVEAADGQVTLKTTARWGEAIDTTYSDCSYYIAAIPVLSDQLSPARARLLARVCTKKPAAPKP